MNCERVGYILLITVAIIGESNIAKIILNKLPINVRIIAWYPRPSKSILCPGRIERAVSSSGAPRKIAGIVSKKVWVIAMEIMKIAIINGVVISNRNAEKLRTSKDIRFTCTPGVNPV